MQGIARRIGYGVAGAMVARPRPVLPRLALLRVIQTTLHSLSTGSWSWVAYLIVVLFAAGVSGLALWRISKIEKEVN